MKRGRRGHRRRPLQKYGPHRFSAGWTKPAQEEIVILAEEEHVTTTLNPIDLAAPATFATATFALG